MIEIQARGFDQFLSMFMHLRAHSVDVRSAGGNVLRVPDDTPAGLLYGAPLASDGAEAAATVAEPGAESPLPPVSGAVSESETDPKPETEAEPALSEPKQTSAPKRSTTRRPRSPRKSQTEE